MHLDHFVQLIINFKLICNELLDDTSKISKLFLSILYLMPELYACN